MAACVVGNLLFVPCVVLQGSPFENIFIYLLGFIMNFAFSWIPPFILLRIFPGHQNFQKIYFNPWSSNILTIMPAFSLLITICLVDLAIMFAFSVDLF